MIKKLLLIIIVGVNISCIAQKNNSKENIISEEIELSPNRCLIDAEILELSISISDSNFYKASVEIILRKKCGSSVTSLPNGKLTDVLILKRIAQIKSGDTINAILSIPTVKDGSSQYYYIYKFNKIKN